MRRAASVVWPQCILRPFIPKTRSRPTGTGFLRGKKLWAFTGRYDDDHWTSAVFIPPVKKPNVLHLQESIDVHWTTKCTRTFQAI